MSSSIIAESQLLSESIKKLAGNPLPRAIVATTELSRASEALRNTFVPFVAESNAVANVLVAKQAIRAMETVRPAIAQSSAIVNIIADSSMVKQAARAMDAVRPAVVQCGAIAHTIADSSMVKQAARAMDAVRPAVVQCGAIAHAIADSSMVKQAARAMDAVRPAVVQCGAIAHAIADSSMVKQAARAMDAARPAIEQFGAIENRIAGLSQATLAIRSRLAVLDRMPSTCPLAPLTPPDPDPIGRSASLSRSDDIGRFPHVSDPSILEFGSEFLDEDTSSDTSSTCSEDEVKLSAILDTRISFRRVMTSEHHLQKNRQLGPYVIITYLERSLRKFVVQRLKTVCGPRWFEQCVRKDILKRWISREQEDQHSGGFGHTLIEYSNFMDLFFVITDQRNWRSTFEPFFRDKEETAVSFRRLRRIRNGIAHCRQLNDEHEITLISEARWILSRISQTSSS